MLMIAALRHAALQKEKIVHSAERDWPPGALGGIVAHFEAAIVGKARHKGDSLFSPQFFLARLTSRATDQSPIRHARMGETTATAPLRRSLIPACRIVIQNRHEPALDPRDASAIAASVTSLPVYGWWVRRSRRAARRIHPDRRHNQKPRDKHTDDSHDYPTFGFHFPPSSLNASQRSASAMLVPLRRA
jgi:hypothetical protein